MKFFKNYYRWFIMVQYVGTRGNDGIKPDGVNIIDVVFRPSSGFGGLYVPDVVKKLSERELKKLLKLSYQDLAFEIVKLFGVDIDEESLRQILKVYENFDDPNNPAPVVKLTQYVCVQELWHGQTRAFKDMALQPFPRLLSHFAQQSGKKYLVAATTSGDTGPATLAGFKDLTNTKVVVFYPVGGTSTLQQEQMLKAQGNNLKVVGVRNTDFDSIQAELKRMLKSESVNEKLRNSGFELSAANSVNFGRIVFQIVYHFWSYFELFRNSEIFFGQEITYIVPSGNMGDALGAFYAKMMGIPIKKIALASNENNVLTQFVNEGKYDISNRPVKKTNSPAMDIVISSNLERILYFMFGEVRTLELMRGLEEQKYFELSTTEKNLVQEFFSAGFATDDEVLEEIRATFADISYLMDPHTATAFVVKSKLNISGMCIIVSTAEWTKFAETIAEAFACYPDLKPISMLLGVKIPKQIKELNELLIVHYTVINIDDMEKELLAFVD